MLLKCYCLNFPFPFSFRINELMRTRLFTCVAIAWFAIGSFAFAQENIVVGDAFRTGSVSNGFPQFLRLSEVNETTQAWNLGGVDTFYNDINLTAVPGNGTVGDLTVSSGVASSTVGGPFWTGAQGPEKRNIFGTGIFSSSLSFEIAAVAGTTYQIELLGSPSLNRTADVTVDGTLFADDLSTPAGGSLSVLYRFQVVADADGIDIDFSAGSGIQPGAGSVTASTTPFFGAISITTVAPPLPPEPGRGHRVLLERGLQLSALSFAQENFEAGAGAFDVARWDESNFTTVDSFYSPYDESSLPTAPGTGIPWSRWLLADTPQHRDIEPGEDVFVPNLVRLQIGDEQDISNAANLAVLANTVPKLRAKYPDVLIHTNQQGSQNTAAELRAYMLAIEPDMLMMDTYVFDGSVSGGSPTELYRDMEKYRKLGIAGNDGTGANPIPTGLYTQTYIRDGHTPSGSEIRLNNFSAWAFGFKIVDSFVYDNPIHNSDVLPAMFSGNGTGSPTVQFFQVSETNRQSLNLGPALVRLLSTDLRMDMGRNSGGGSNPLPAGVSAWNAAADPFITNITATNLGDRNGGNEGDVIVGYFKPLEAEFTNPGFEDDIYFMVVNGLSDELDGASFASQQILLEFDFGSSGIDSLLRLSRDTGLVEVVNLVSNGGSLYSLDLILEGGTGDLFKFNNGGLFVGLPEDADFDEDNDVDGQDFLAWQRGFGSAGGLADGDANGDGVVNGSDLAIWEGQFGTVAALGALAGASTAVPEPTTLGLFLAATGLLLTRRVRREI